MLKPVGLNGQIRVLLDEEIASINPPQTVFQFRDERFFPWFVRGWETADDGSEILLSLEDIDSPEKARKLCGETLWVEADHVVMAPDSDGREDLIGYELRDQDGKAYGPITEIIDNAGQWLAVVAYQGRELLVPLADENILGVQDQERYLQIELPDGLLDL